MKRTHLALISAALLLATTCVVNALYSVADRGTWPATWPKELEPLRKQSRSLCGPMAPEMLYEIPFANRAEFEAAWPHLLSLKSPKAPIFLERGPYKALGGTIKAGVVVHTPPIGTDKRVTPEVPLAGDPDARGTWMNTTYIVLVVDGDVVDLNKTRLPSDTPFVDERDAQPKGANLPASRHDGASPAKLSD